MSEDMAKEIKSPVELFGRETRVVGGVRDFRPRPIKVGSLEDIAGPTDADLAKLEQEIQSGQLSLNLEEPAGAAGDAAGAAGDGAGNAPAPTPPSKD